MRQLQERLLGTIVATPNVGKSMAHAQAFQISAAELSLLSSSAQRMIYHPTSILSFLLVRVPLYS